jgi:hypothetical protein
VMSVRPDRETTMRTFIRVSPLGSESKGRLFVPLGVGGTLRQKR